MKLFHLKGLALDAVTPSTLAGIVADGEDDEVALYLPLLQPRLAPYVAALRTVAGAELLPRDVLVERLVASVAGQEQDEARLSKAQRKAARTAQRKAAKGKQ